MTNIDTRWEQALLNKVTSNGERIAVIERDVKEIKDNSLKVQEDISTLKSDVSTLKSDVSTLKSDVSNIDGRLSDIEKLIHDAKKIMQWLLGGMGAVFLSLVANFIYSYLH